MFILNEVDHPDMIVCKQRGDAEILFEDEHGILMQDTKTKFVMADATTIESAKKIIDCINKEIEDVIIRGAILYHQVDATAQFHTAKGYSFVSFREDIALPNKHTISHRKLDASYIDIVCNHYSYKELADFAYISQVIEEGMIGAFYYDELIGFIGLHDTGSIGLLEVFPAYQHKGIAQSLLAEMIHYRRRQGFLPFGEVFEDNVASKQLLHKMGYLNTSKLAYWIVKQ